MMNSFHNQRKQIIAYMIAIFLFTTNCAEELTSEGDDPTNSATSKVDTQSQSPSPDDQTETSDKETNSLDDDCETESCEKPVEILVPKCGELTLVNSDPKSIQDFVDLVNELPKPVTVNCVVEALERPLTISATSNRFSAQGATGSTSP